MAKLKKTTLYIKGMHCHSCDVLIKKKFKEIPNVKEVLPHYVSKTAEVTYTGLLDKQVLNQRINQYGYSVVEKEQLAPTESMSKKLTDVTIIAVILFTAYYFAKQLNILPTFTGSSTLSYGAAFVLGLVASTSTCMATSGALFMSTVGKLNKSEASTIDNLIPAVSFNLGRVLSYGAFGFVAGMLGQAISANVQVGPWLTLFVSIMMVLVALDMLKIYSVTHLMGTSFTKGLFEKLEARLIKSPKKTAFFLGAITYLLPCGFTQSVQLYALGLSNPVHSALTMMVFALGTVPALLAIGFASSFTKSSYYPMFIKVMGVFVFVIGASYFLNFLSIYGVNFNVLSASPKQSDATTANQTNENYQEVSMTASPEGYSPNAFTVKAGVPVKWKINATNIYGCWGTVLSPKLGIQKTLSLGNNTVEFTPQEKGTIPFSCTMGMYRGSFTVI